MKIALCLSGQPRFFEKGYGFFKNNLIDHYNPDIFFHTWFGEDSIGQPHPGSACNVGMVGNIQANTDTKLIELYKPKKHIIERQRYPNNLGRDFLSEGESVLSCMFYSIQRANELKTDYEKEMGVKYDCVVRARFDLALFDKIEFEKHNLNVINSSDVLNAIPPKPICDYLWFSNSENMNRTCNVYDSLKKYFCEQEMKSNSGENILTHHCNINRIAFNDSHHISMLLIRNNSPDKRYGRVF
jgi:hypothetical protein